MSPANQRTNYVRMTSYIPGVPYDKLMELLSSKHTPQPTQDDDVTAFGLDHGSAIAYLRDNTRRNPNSRYPSVLYVAVMAPNERSADRSHDSHVQEILGSGASASWASTRTFSVPMGVTLEQTIRDLRAAQHKILS